MMRKIELFIVGLSSSLSQDGKNYALILQEVHGERKFPMIIGPYEGQAIAVVMEKLKPARPITHDLFKNTLDMLRAAVKEVIITSVEKAVFYAQMILTTPDGEYYIDARPSDAIAMAIRFNSPVFTYENVLAEVSVIENMDGIELKKGSLAEYSLEELEELMASILAKEDYESAARVRDVIERRKGLK